MEKALKRQRRLGLLVNGWHGYLYKGSVSMSGTGPLDARVWYRTPSLAYEELLGVW